MFTDMFLFVHEAATTKPSTVLAAILISFSQANINGNDLISFALTPNYYGVFDPV